MNRKVSNAEELLELIRSAVKDVDRSINDAVSNLKEAKAYAEDIEYTYANDLYNLAERGVEEREINATSLDIDIEAITNTTYGGGVFMSHFTKHIKKFDNMKKFRIRFYEILDKEEGNE